MTTRTPTRTYTIPDEIQAIFQEIADTHTEGNVSMAVRYLARQWKLNKDLKADKD